MKLFIDCEFNGYLGQLLSMALVDENQNSFYCELAVHEAIVPWVDENVYPLMSDAPVDYPVFQEQLGLFLNSYDDIYLIADWPDDVRYFMQALITGPGERLDTPPLSIEVRRDLDAVSEQPHHALADAYAIRNKYYDIMQSEDSDKVHVRVEHTDGTVEHTTAEEIDRRQQGTTTTPHSQ